MRGWDSGTACLRPHIQRYKLRAESGVSIMGAMDWYKVTLPFKEGGIGGLGKQLQDAFEVLFVRNGGLRDAAMFTNHDETFDNVIYYFSPSAGTFALPLIETFKGERCSQPSRGEVNLLVGHSDALKRLLAEPEKN